MGQWARMELTPIFLRLLNLLRAMSDTPNWKQLSEAERSLVETFDKRLLNATYMLASTFFFSSVMNYIMAKWIVTSPTGTEAFNEELGRLTLVSYPMIAIPSMLMMFGVLYYLWKTIHGLTGLNLDELMVLPEHHEKETTEK